MKLSCISKIALIMLMANPIISSSACPDEPEFSQQEIEQTIIALQTRHNWKVSTAANLDWEASIKELERRKTKLQNNPTQNQLEREDLVKHIEVMIELRKYEERMATALEDQVSGRCDTFKLALLNNTGCIEQTTERLQWCTKDYETLSTLRLEKRSIVGRAFTAATQRSPEDFRESAIERLRANKKQNEQQQ